MWNVWFVVIIFIYSGKTRTLQVLKDENLQRKIACFGDLTAIADDIDEAWIQAFLKL